MALRHLCAALMIGLFCALTAFAQAESASVNVKPGGSWFGIYVDGTKQGSLHITVEKKKGATAEYYSIVGQESRAFKVKDKDVTESCDYKAALGLDLRPMSYEALETKGTTKNTIKAKVAAGVAEITIQFGTSAANPPRKVNLTEGDCWSFCAPYIFATRKIATDKPRRYGKIVEVGCAVISFSVSGEKKKTSFQGKNTAATEWVETESQKFTLVQGEDGSPLWWSETTKAKVTTKYISEPEEVAKSPLDYDQYVKKAKEEGKKLEKQGASDLTGTRFENALEPVRADEEEADDSHFIRDKKLGYSIRIAEQWRRGGGFSMEKFKMEGRGICPDKPRHRAGPPFALVISTREREKDEKPADVIDEFVKAETEHKLKGDLEILKFDAKTTIVGAEIEAKMLGSEQTVTYYVFAACSDTNVYFAWPFVFVFYDETKAELEEYKDDMDAMMGSFRIIDIVEAE
ncbi:MAG: hypothetical protein WC712_09135 [Candidatus Brocadiia bacterium]